MMCILVLFYLSFLDNADINLSKFLIGVVENKTPLRERIKEQDISMNYLTEKMDTVVITDNSYFANYDIKKHFEYMIINFLNEYNSGKEGEKIYSVNFEIKNYAVYFIPDKKAIKQKKEAGVHALIGGGLFLTRMAYVWYMLRKEKVDYGSFLPALIYLTVIPRENPLWWTVVISAYIFSISSVVTGISAEQMPRDLKGILRTKVKVIDEKGEVVLEREIKGEYKEKRKVKELFDRNMLFKYIFKKDVIKEFMKKTELNFLIQLKDILDSIRSN